MGRNTESETTRGQEGSAAPQEETPASHHKPTAKAEGEPEQTAGARETGHDRRSGSQNPGNPSLTTETNRNKDNKGEAPALANGRSKGNRARPQKLVAEPRKPEPDHRNNPHQEPQGRSPSTNS